MQDDVLQYIKESVTRIEKNQDAQDIRLRALESWQSTANGKIGAVASIGVIVGAALAAASNFFKH
jgi:hypothetical protein